MSGKKGRAGISLDMTAMCDMAFLLLTFFILTAKMKTPEIIQVDVPTAQAKKLVPDKNLIRITLDKQGKVYLSLTEPSIKKIKSFRNGKNYFCKYRNVWSAFESVERIFESASIKER